MAPQPNGQDGKLALPPAGAPELIQYYPNIGSMGAAFAMYTLVPGMTAARVEEIAAEIEAPWTRMLGDGDFDKDLRLARAPADDDDQCRVASVTEAIAAHAALPKYAEEDVDKKSPWFLETALLLVTKDDVSDPHALLLVYVDTEDETYCPEEDHEDDEPRYDLSGKLDKFFIDVCLAHSAIMSFLMGDNTFNDSKLTYNADSDTYDIAPLIERRADLFS
ncbi:hypothetical protein GGTG_12707 [Gaeumannomyces tritici R3-111a-1]|uniref:Uncharacterized protein n=1 Tax=Gaeumannomyces tritici (strain R3-111a-1) TaxID=644352 RepID=J3PGS7_GAET3|nr:hypothetical protein GGTG_12707 [Gaeumannomyces tritici R3-111a-1]EJT69824.1 hypothetical protein GGTG_12707 [Gaeumannomyces tritici R3-111a-1]